MKHYKPIIKEANISYSSSNKGSIEDAISELVADLIDFYGKNYIKAFNELAEAVVIGVQDHFYTQNEEDEVVDNLVKTNIKKFCQLLIKKV